MRVYCKPCRKHVDGLDKLKPKGNPSDYSQSCVASGEPECKAVGTYCTHAIPCKIGDGTCDCVCPDPLPHSHLVADNCAVSVGGCPCNYLIDQCMAGSCSCSGTCEYDCDEGYYWDGEKCVAEAVPKKLYKGDGTVWLVMQH